MGHGAMSSAASSASGASSGAKEDDLLKQRLEDGDDDEQEQEQTGGIQQGVFGTLFTISKERDVNLPLIFFKLVMDVWQLFLLVVSPSVGFDISYRSKAWQIINFIGLNQFIEARGYTFFIAVLYIFVVLLLMVCAVCVWVTQAFRANRFDHVWPIVFLRAFSTVFFQVLDVMSVSLFLIALNCNYFDVDPAEQYRLNEFPDVQCWSMPHLIHVAVAALSLVLFLALATIAQMGEMELNPVTRNPMAMAHPRVEVLGFCLRMGLTLVNTFITNQKWMAALMCIIAWCLLFTYWKWNPHVDGWVNYCRSASYAAIWYASVCLCFVVFKPDVDKKVASEVESYERGVTTALWAGLAPAALAGAAASWLRLRYFTHTVLRKFVTAAPGTRPRHIHKFVDAREVEIVARCARRWVSQDVLADSAVSLAEAVLKAGVAELPNDAFMVILYSSFLIDVQGSYQSGYTLLQSAKKMEPSFLERFAIFSREQQHAQKASKGGQAADLVSYVEFQRSRRLALRVHRDALLAIREFWQKLLRRDVSFSNLEASIAKIDLTVKNAERVYRTIVQHHANSWQLLRMYSRFLEVVKNDPWSASKWGSEAEELQQAEEEAKNNVFADLDNALAHGNAEDGGEDDTEAVRRAKALKAQMEDSRGVIIINAQAAVVTANQAAHDMFGYAKTELRGQNIKVVIPSPFSDHHDSYVRRYVTTEKPVIIGVTTEFVALHKERYVFPVYLSVTKVSGIGEDSMFMGVLEAIPPVVGVAKAWVMSTGALVSVDAVFSDWFGFKPEDLLGTYVSGLVVEHKRLDEFLKMVKANDKRFVADAGQGATDQSFEIEGLHLKHKYAEPQEVVISVTNGGVGNHAFYVMDVRRTGTHGRHMLVADKRGRICHSTEELAHMLGHTPHSIMANGVTHALDHVMPHPFAQLHHAYLSETQAPLPPPYSCRSGLAVCFMAKTHDGVQMLPFKLRVRKREELGSVHHVVTMDECSWDAAFDQRRLGLMVDPQGNIVKVSNSPKELFGFSARSLVGLSCSHIIDALGPSGGERAVRDPALRAAAAATDAEELQLLLLTLAKRAQAQPGLSWRVGVSPPGDQHGPVDELAQQLASSQRKTRAAVMTVTVHVGGTANSGGGAPGAMTGIKQAKGGLLLEINLWRADLVSGVLEIDGAGKIVNTTEHRLNPAGLVFGVPNEALKGKHISRLLPLADRPVSDLFEPGLGASKGAIRGRLKKSDKPTDGKLKKPGRASVVKATHLADGGELEVAVQAVWKWGMSGNVYVVVHPHQPKCAPPNFGELQTQGRKDSQLSRVGSAVSARSKGPALTDMFVYAARNSKDTNQGGSASTGQGEVAVRMTVNPVAAAGGRKGVRWGGDDDDEALAAIEQASEGGSSVQDDDDDGQMDGEAEAEAAAAGNPALAGMFAVDDRDERGSQVSSSHNSGGSGEQGGMADNTDYRRGQRFKKLQRLLASTNVHRTIKRFKTYALAIVCGIMVAHIAAFAAIMALVTVQQEAVRDLNSMGMAAQNCMDGAYAVRAVDIIHSGLTHPSLVHMARAANESDADLQVQLDKLHTAMDQFKAMASGTYLGFKSEKRLPTNGGARDVWDKPVNNVTLFFPAVNGTAPASQVVQQSLWDISNEYVTKMKNIWSNHALLANANNATGTGLDMHPDVRYVVANGVDVIVPGFYTTLDAVVEEVISSASTIEKAQLLLLAIEGCALTGVVVVAMWALSTAVAVQRHALYSVFMVLPQGLVRGLASKALVIEDGDVGDSAGLPDAGDPGGNEGEAEGAGMIKLQVAQGEELTLVQRMMSSAMFWRASSTLHPSASKRKLKRSYKRTVWFVSPFVVWGLMIIIINVVGHNQITKIDGPIATFNLVNFVAIRVQRVASRMIEISYAGSMGDHELQDKMRAAMPPRIKQLRTEYRAMLYGHAATPEETSAHFTRAKSGVIFTGTEGAALLYKDRTCLSDEPATCQEAGASQFEVTHHGVDMMVQQFLELVEGVVASREGEPTLASEEFAAIWNTHSDLMGGLNQLNKIFEKQVQGVYGATLTMHIIGLVLTAIILGAYLLLVLRPFLAESAAESKRIAELLTQLPPEVDVEGLLRATLMKGMTADKGKLGGANKVAPFGDNSMPGRLASDAGIGGNAPGKVMSADFAAGAVVARRGSLDKRASVDMGKSPRAAKLV